MRQDVIPLAPYEQLQACRTLALAMRASWRLGSTPKSLNQQAKVEMPNREIR
jgi:hypothetical protein